MWIEVAAQPDPWQWGWEALAAIGTISATVLALGLAVFPYILRRRTDRVGPAENAHVTAEDTGSTKKMNTITVYNAGTHPIFDVVVVLRRGDEAISLTTAVNQLNPGETTRRDWASKLYQHPECEGQPLEAFHVFFHDHRARAWVKNSMTDRYYRSYQDDPSIWHLAPVSLKDRITGAVEKAGGLRSFLGSSWTSLRGFFEKRHLTILEVFLLLTIVFLVIHNAQLVN